MSSALHVGVPAAAPRGRSTFLLGPLRVLVQHRQLIARLVRREVEQRYRDSVLGLLWTLLTPLLMLLVYSFVFTQVFASTWSGEATATPMPLLLFCGLILFGVLSEPVNRAPGLILENVNYVKKVVFPLEALAWVALLSNLVQTAVSLLVWLVIHALWVGVPPWTILLVPLAILPVCLLTLGLTWALAALGVFLRDLRQIVPVCTTILMFLSPIFFSSAAIRSKSAVLVDLNPLAWTIEFSRDLMVYGRLPDPLSYTLLLLACGGVAVLGLWLFRRLRMAFSDVV